jgi:signal peptidase II
VNVSSVRDTGTAPPRDRPHVPLPWLGLALSVIALDQVTKYMVIRILTLHTPVEVLPFFSLTLAHNTGAAFSFLNDGSGWQRWFFTGLGAVVSAAIVYWLSRLPAAARWQSAALSLILGGALGNVWDRLQLGYVIDFLDFYYNDWHWPAFNIADSSITIGAIMLVIDALRSGKAPA